MRSCREQLQQVAQHNRDGQALPLVLYICRAKRLVVVPCVFEVVVVCVLHRLVDTGALHNGGRVLVLLDVSPVVVLIEMVCRLVAVALLSLFV